MPINEEKSVELSKAVAGLVVAIEASSPTKIGDRSKPNLETTKLRPIRATHVLNNQTRNVL